MKKFASRSIAPLHWSPQRDEIAKAFTLTGTARRQGSAAAGPPPPAIQFVTVDRQRADTGGDQPALGAMGAFAAQTPAATTCTFADPSAAVSGTASQNCPAGADGGEQQHDGGVETSSAETPDEHVEQRGPQRSRQTDHAPPRIPSRRRRGP